jgi:hypothetical protein
MKARGIVISFIVVGAFLSGIRAANALPYVTGAGTLCQPEFPYDPNASYFDAINHLVNGAANPSTTRNAVYLCPLPLGTQNSSSVTHSTLIVTYKDLSTVDAFWCEVHNGYNDGSVYWSVAKYTCGTAGGCSTTSDTSYTGGNYLAWNSTDLGSNATQYLNGNYGIDCGVPKNTGNLSWIDSYYAY